MKLICNGKEVARLDQTHRKMLEGGQSRDLVMGQVLSANTASKIFRRRTKRGFNLIGIVSLVIIGGLVIVSSLSGSSTLMLIYIPALIGILIFILWTTITGPARAARPWDKQLLQRVSDLPESGTTVRLDANGLTIGTLRAPWTELRIARLEYTALDNGDSEVVEIKRIILVCGRTPMTLDTDFIENGRLMTSTACRRLLAKEM